MNCALAALCLVNSPHYHLCYLVLVFFFQQKSAYGMRISDWSSDVCSSDLACRHGRAWPPVMGRGVVTGDGAIAEQPGQHFGADLGQLDRKSVVWGKRVSVVVVFGGRLMIKKKRRSIQEAKQHSS